ncbi:MAG: hypothetical protein RLZ36_1657 [Pseudomonadota bacterium]
MAEETTEVTQEASEADTPAVSEGADAPVAASEPAEAQASTDGTDSSEELVSAAPSTQDATVDNAAKVAPAAESSEVPPASSETPAPQEPDDVQPFVDRAFETIQHEVEHQELDTFLRAHIKTFREEWDTWPDSAKDAYMHMMTSQLLQRKAANTRIMNYEEFNLPVPSAQTKLFESLKLSQVKPKKCVPVLLLPPNLRPTYSLKK